MPPANIAIKVESLSKVYHLYDSPRDRLKEALHPMRKKYHHDFYALKEVSFEIKKGETIGIIGQNGSGKSTLLKILSNVLTPTGGSYLVNGKVSSLLELGIGFNPELTGIENVYFNGTLLGFTRAEMEAKMDDIISFADIGEFVRQPVKTYSSGMYVRLAFSMVTCIDPEILIIDEALSVGDTFFQAKSMTKMTKLIKEQNLTLLFVSHDMNAVNALCSKAMWFENGVLRDFDTSSKVTKSYLMSMLQKQQELFYSTNHEDDFGKSQKEDWPVDDQFKKKSSFGRHQNGKSEFYNFLMLNSKMQKSNIFEYNEKVTLQMGIMVMQDLSSLSVGYTISNKNGVELIGTNSFVEDQFIVSPRAGERYIVRFTLNASLAAGSYNILISQSIPKNIENQEIEVCDRIPCIYQFEVYKRKGAPLPTSVGIHNELLIEKL
jgi:lipopolysaccharide transport system ATP-binding protein